MTSPLRISFEVACRLGHAFGVWTERIGQWWPADHTVSGDIDSVVVLEGREGGRIFERAGNGVEHEWGQVTVWDPPHRLGYTWHLGRPEAEATAVEVRFSARSDSVTEIEIVHEGWDRLGETAEVWRDRNRVGWETLLPHFVAAVGRQEANDGWR